MLIHFIKKDQKKKKNNNNNSKCSPPKFCPSPREKSKEKKDKC